MAVNVTQLNALVDAAVSAIGTGDYSTARTKLLQAQAMLAAIPDRRQGDLELRYIRDTIPNLLRQVNGLIAATGNGSTTGAIQTTKTRYVQPTDC